ncbi:hypothetical protein ONZ45_g663 [Pleurotus djamor]|nr:hypothetical protein ONZ45_g663 [Pleurotus djamor]
MFSNTGNKPIAWANGGEFGFDVGVENWITECDGTTSCEEFLTVAPFRPARTTSPSHLGLLSKLPPEMISYIFEHMSSTTAMAMLATTNSQLFLFAYPFLARRALEYFSPWPYTRLICIGDKADKLPEGCVSTQEWAHIQDLDDDSDGLELEGHILYSVASEHFDSPARKPFLETWRSFGKDWRDSYRYSFFADPCEPTPFIKEPTSKVMINVTKHEYVKETENVTFKYCLSPLIVWGHPDAGLSERGPWAGDRLAITSSEKFETKLKEEGVKWVDITEKAGFLQAKFRKWHG